MKGVKAGGLLFLLVGLALLALNVQFKAFTFCLGAKLLGACLGVSENFTWGLWVVVVILGFILLVAG